MELKNQISPEFVSLFSNKDFIETVKGLSLYLAHENEEFRKDMTAALFPDVEEIIEAKIKESYASPYFEAALDTGLSTLDIFRNIPRRVKELEVAVGIRECDPDEIKDYAVPVRIQTLEDSINNYKPGLTVSSCIDKIPESKTEQRAVCLAEAVEASEKGFFTASEIIEFLKCKLPDSCKLDENVQNIRKVKQDVIKKIEKMFKHIKGNKKEHGHGDVRLVCNLA